MLNCVCTDVMVLAHREENQVLWLGCRADLYGSGAGASVPLPATGRAPPTGGMKRGMYPVQKAKYVSMYRTLIWRVMLLSSCDDRESGVERKVA